MALPLEKGWAEQFVTATVDTALLAQNVLLAAESLGMGGVFIGGIRNDPQTVCDLLAIPDQAYPVFGMCLGWPAHDPPPKPRLPVEAVLFDDRYPEKHDRAVLDEYDRVTNHYYLNRDSQSEGRNLDPPDGRLHGKGDPAAYEGVFRKERVFPEVETIYGGPYRRSRLFEILDVALLRLRFPKVCGLDLNRQATVSE
jgi:hypothetical protein